MMKFIAATAFAVASFTGMAQAAVITNGVVTIGVNQEGHLQDGNTGILANLTGHEAIANGCACEGWGVGIASTGNHGNASRDNGGIENLQLVSFTSTASSAISVVKIIGDGGVELFQVTHEYVPNAASSALYNVNVSITNLTANAIAKGDLIYRRSMDWDVAPTPFNEYVSIGGVPSALGIANGSNLYRVGDNGFSYANPFSTTSLAVSCPINANFNDCGPADHGSVFDFQFLELGAGSTLNFTTVYGVAPTEIEADAARAAAGIGIYSYGQSAATPTGETFIFGFRGAGGVLNPDPDPDPVPEPASIALFGLGLIGMGALRRRRA
jgi:hypothetical protein